MVVILVIIVGALLGFISFKVYGLGYSLGSYIVLGIVGSVAGSVITTVSYVLNQFNKENAIGLNWFSLTVAAIGAISLICASLLFKKLIAYTRIGLPFKVFKVS